MNIIETHNLSHNYGKTEAVRSLTFSVSPSDACALLGPNGAGKTTTLKILMNLLRPSRGSATVLGTDSRKLSPAEFQQIGYVSENQKLPAGMTVRGLLDFCRKLYPKWDVDLETRLLARFELPPERKLAHLSRGMRMKAMLLSSLAYRPKLIVLDEPFSGLDPVVRDELTHGILELAGTGEWALLVSSHDIDDVERLVETAVIIESGALLINERVDSLRSRFRRVEASTFTGAPSDLPRTCIGFEHVRTQARWIETDFSPQTESDYRTAWPSGSFILQPMSLKEIYMVVVKNAASRKGTKTL
ncbi:ABC-2 type transport system ATP-binding protein [Ereboglobus sp. PH5-10]|uniref:ABC transporter ATP-binding protein n=1 Tax=Ereboglobus sp. PH5-10 TaxID=2940629 RepID=UPI0024075FFB|nr:ABC transporter ATP-binding protein [Ereboglobus sp. PH5-10]MDF9827481.1 ABC-2 type transport system ATP-binding protein [Ereboglobus sp. PH5-10]